MSKHQHAKDLYLAGNNIATIAELLGISRTSIYAYKKKDQGRGMDWDDMRFLKATDANDAQRKEEQFVALLIFQFEKALDNMEAMDDAEPEKKLAIISKHIDTYYKLKKQQSNPKVSKASIAKDVLHKISEVALEKEATAVIQFLSTHADQIVSTVIA